MPYMMIARLKTDDGTLWHWRHHDSSGSPLPLTTDEMRETRRIGGDEWCKPDPPKEELCPICFPHIAKSP